MKIKETARIISQECLCGGIFSMWIKTKAAKYAEAGQFISVYPKSAARLLPRPISICEIKAPDELRIVYRVAGKGTEEFSHYRAGDEIEILGPNGNGFFAAAGEETEKNKKALLFGGGIGIPPMLELAKQLECEVSIIAGYRSAEDTFLMEELEEAGKLYVATDDGSLGVHGTVIDAAREYGIGADIVFACGPLPMLRAVKVYSEERNIPAYVSMEERMACGVGACLGCVCTSVHKDDHSKVNNKRICADGPVFPASEVEL